MRNKIIIALVLMLAGAVFADYRGWFGVREERTGDYLHVIFQFVDAQSRVPVSDVHVACTRPMVRSACTETRGPGPGQTTITLGAYRITRRSLLFSEDLGYSLGAAGGMNLTFIPANHERASRVLLSEDPILGADRALVIELVPKPD